MDIRLANLLDWYCCRPVLWRRFGMSGNDLQYHCKRISISDYSRGMVFMVAFFAAVELLGRRDWWVVTPRLYGGDHAN